MGITIYTAIICLAVTCLAHDFLLPSLQDSGVQARGLNRLLRARALNEPLIELSPREAEPTQSRTSPTRGSNPPRPNSRPPAQPNPAPPRSAQAFLSNLPDSLHKFTSALNSPPLKSPGTSRHASPTKLHEDATRDSPGSIVDRSGKGGKQKKDQQPARKSKSPTKQKGKIGAQTKPPHTNIRQDSTGPVGVQPYDRAAHDSGARPSSSIAERRPSKDTTISKTLLSEQSQTRLIEHDQWLTETKASLQKAENSAARMSKAAKHPRRNQSPQMVEAQLTTNRLKKNSRESRTKAKGALLKADQFLNTVPASDRRTQACLSSTDQQVRIACAAGAMHAKMEREAAKTATEDKRWDLTANHVKASAKAMTRARAFEAQSTALLAQYQAKADTEKIKSLPPGDPQREKADQKVKFSQADYQDKATFYKSVHDQYRQTRKDFAGSESEDEERIFPDVLLRDPKQRSEK